MIAEADAENTGRITYAQFKRVIAEQKKNQSLTNEEDTLDAFVAMGGEANGEGYINAERLIRIIKEEFEMTIDIEKLIRDIDEDGSGKIEYDEFRNLLSSSDWMNRNTCRNEHFISMLIINNLNNYPFK